MKKIRDIFKKEIQTSVPVNVEIDYDKLAEAIVKAQRKANLPNKKGSKYRAALYVGFNTVFYLAIFFLFSQLGIAIWKGYTYTDIFSLITRICVTLTLLLFSIIALLARKEAIDADNIDARESFTANVGFLAMILAALAYFK